MFRLVFVAVVNLAILSAAAASSTARAAEIFYRGGPAELVVEELSERMLQITLAPVEESTDEARPPAESQVLVPLERSERLRTRKLAGGEQATVGELRVEFSAQPLTVTIRRASGEVVQQLTIDDAGDGAMHFRAEAPVLGMGEGAKQFDRRDAYYSMKDGWGAWERPTHGSWVAVPLLVGTDGWAMFVHHPIGEFELSEDDATFTPWAEQKNMPLEVYVIAWDEPGDVLRETNRMFGQTPLPPKWALGFMQSHRTLSGPQEVLDVARTFREKKLPCDALIYLGTGYCPAGWNTGHASLEFNPETFDKPQEMIDELRSQNFRVVLHKNAPPQRFVGDSVADPGDSQRRSHIANYWARHRDVFAMGVDGWWPDDGDPLSRDSRILRHRLYYEGALLDRPNVRPWALHRTGYAGVQRYGGWIWSGDIDSRWRTLATQVMVGQNHSLSLTPYWGTDIGGFYPSRELTGELYVRWFQFGAFCPSFRAHGRTWHLRRPWGWNTGEMGPLEHPENPSESELNNPEVEPICRQYLELRYQMLPYNYSLCREAYDTGLPLMRAMWLHYPDDEQAVARGDQYLWGRDILVAPVVEKGATERKVYLPAGEWYDYWTGERHTGGRETTRSVDLATMPLFVCAGAIVPHDPVRQYTAESVDEPTTIRVYTGADGEFCWYDDDGESLDYEQSEEACSVLRLSWSDEARRLTIAPDNAAAPARELVVELVPGGEQKAIQFDRREVAVEF